MLVTIGLLAMAGSTALALRTSVDTQRRREAVHRIESRFASLNAAGCNLARSGADADVARVLTERWTVAPSGAAFARVTDSVVWMGARGISSLAITSAIAC